ncbi:unnamed protein product [Phytophthora fragariaefolia]|uniref:Unnamed protein product n=1 Tax=Phytophthora fragariaefolia TaxID=1490495 RepID=A0A9W7CNB5_9STRA|nr:unnamed protein product [Phytophthora fragariaefolia]
MAPPPTLQAVKYVLLLPELLDQCIQEPQYAKVTRRMRSGITLCGIGSERERKWKITIEQALAWAVSADEVETNPSPLIRSPVVIIKDGHFIHGQVAACNGKGAVVNTVGGIHRVTQSSFVMSAPIAYWAPTAPPLPTTSSKIMHGIIDDVMTPSADEIVTWINPLSGQEVAFPVQHAVDYAFYQDGGVEPTPDLILAALASQPRLQRIFAENYLPDSSVVASTSTQVPITSTTTLGSSGVRLNSAQGEAVPNFNVRNASVPTSSQIQVHEAVAAPRHQAPQPKDVHEVVAACQTLELFAGDYFSADLKASITALVALVTGLARSHVWEADDLPLLVYWINVTLEEYRTQISQATLVPGEFKKTFSLENSSLQHILQPVSSR